MKYCVRYTANDCFFFETDYLVQIKSVINLIDPTTRINLIEIYNVDYVDQKLSVIHHFKTQFPGTVSVTTSNALTFIEPSDGSVVRDIMREMIDAGIEVSDRQ